MFQNFACGMSYTEYFRPQILNFFFTNVTTGRYFSTIFVYLIGGKVTTNYMAELVILTTLLEL